MSSSPRSCATSAARLFSYDRVVANPPFSLKEWGRDFAPNDPHHRFDRFGADPAQDQGRPRLPPAHARRHEPQGDGGRGDAPRHPLPRRRRGDHPPGHRRGRPVRGGHRAGAQPLLRRQHPRGCLHPEQAQAAQSVAARYSSSMPPSPTTSARARGRTYSIRCTCRASSRPSAASRRWSASPMWRTWRRSLPTTST